MQVFNELSMKTRRYLLIFSLVTAAIFGSFNISNAQLTKNGINFQAVARDHFSNPLKSTQIYVQPSIIQSSATGSKVYIEEHQVTTDATGIFNVTIGQGSRTGGSVNDIQTIDWANGPYFLNLKISLSTSTSGLNNRNWIDLGTTQLGTVPYAQYAGNVAGLSNKLNISDTSLMLAGYARTNLTIDPLTLKALLANKVNVQDSITAYVTPAMLNAKTATISTFGVTNTVSSLINTKLNISDTAVMLKPYATHQDLADQIAAIALTPGPQGAQGVSGLPGAQGLTGVAGANGTNGTNGADGKNGVDGAAGAAGATGSQGPTGLTGAAGAAGSTAVSYTHLTLPTN